MSEHIIRYKDGSIQGKGQVVDGVMIGKWEWFRKNGSKMRSGQFDDAGKPIGEWITYDQKGEVYKVTNKK